MKLPDLQNLRNKVDSMRNESIGNDFEFVGKVKSP